MKAPARIANTPKRFPLRTLELDGETRFIAGAPANCNFTPRIMDQAYALYRSTYSRIASRIYKRGEWEKRFFDPFSRALVIALTDIKGDELFGYSSFSNPFEYKNTAWIRGNRLAAQPQLRAFRKLSGMKSALAAAQEFYDVGIFIESGLTPPARIFRILLMGLGFEQVKDQKLISAFIEGGCQRTIERFLDEGEYQRRVSTYKAPQSYVLLTKDPGS